MTDPTPQPAPAPAVAEALSDFETFCRVASGPYADALYTSLLLLIESREAQRDAALAAAHAAHAASPSPTAASAAPIGRRG